MEQKLNFRSLFDKSIIVTVRKYGCVRHNAAGHEWRKTLGFNAISA